MELGNGERVVSERGYMEYVGVDMEDILLNKKGPSFNAAR